MLGIQLDFYGLIPQALEHYWKMHTAPSICLYHSMDAMKQRTYARSLQFKIDYDYTYLINRLSGVRNMWCVDGGATGRDGAFQILNTNIGVILLWRKY